MSTKNLFLLAAILAFTSCNFLRKDIANDKILFHSNNLLIDSNKITSIECNEFVLNALSRYNIEIITRIFPLFDRTIEPVINMHDSSFIDTVYTFLDKKNKIQIYRAKNTDFIIFFDVTDSKYSLNGNVKTGITKDAFIQKFQITESISDIVQVVNSDSSMKFIFYFKNNRLQRIKSDLYLD